MPITIPASGVRAGTVAYFAAGTQPAGWLVCNGAAVSRAIFGALFLAIGTTYGAGDGATTFNLPDLRGEFIRCADQGRGVDVGRVLGTMQGHQMQSHSHPVQMGTGTSAEAAAARAFQLDTTIQSGAAGGTSNSSENRPRNVALLPCIRH